MRVRRALTFWRRSIQARVVASTVVLSAVVVGIVGAFLMQQTRDGLVDNRVDQVIAEAENETADARNKLGFAQGIDVDELRPAGRADRPDLQPGRLARLRGDPLPGRGHGWPVVRRRGQVHPEPRPEQCP